MGLVTLPKLSVQCGISLDRLRETVRSDPGLRAMGVTIGSARAYTQPEAEAIVTAAKQTKRKQVAAITK